MGRRRGVRSFWSFAKAGENSTLMIEDQNNSFCGRSGDVRNAMKGDSSWVRETANHAGQLFFLLQSLSRDTFILIINFTHFLEDICWLAGERSRTQAELAALREARRDQVED